MSTPTRRGASKAAEKRRRDALARKARKAAKSVKKTRKTEAATRQRPKKTPRKAKAAGRADVMSSIAELLEAAVAANAAAAPAPVPEAWTPTSERDVRQLGTLHSNHLGIDIGYAWYGTRGRPLVLFPTSGGNHLENEERGLIAALFPKIAAGELQAICVESINRESWQRKDLEPAERLRRHDLFDRFLAEEFFPFVRAMAPEGKLGVYGASMGGYHAVNVAARHPDLVDQCIALSGLFDVHRLLNNDPFWNDTCYFHSPEAYIPNMDPEWACRLARVDWVIATGEHDSLVDESRRLHSILASKGIPCRGEIWPGVFGHDWPFWREHLPRFV